MFCFFFLTEQIDKKLWTCVFSFFFYIYKHKQKPRPSMSSSIRKSVRTWSCRLHDLMVIEDRDATTSPCISQVKKFKANMDIIKHLRDYTCHCTIIN